MSVKQERTGRYTSTTSINEATVLCMGCGERVPFTVPDGNGRELCLECNPQAAKDDLIRLVVEDGSEA